VEQFRAMRTRLFARKAETTRLIGRSTNSQTFCIPIVKSPDNIRSKTRQADPLFP
jgi:hypothetical protein